MSWNYIFSKQIHVSFPSFSPSAIWIIEDFKIPLLGLVINGLYALRDFLDFVYACHITVFILLSVLQLLSLIIQLQLYKRYRYNNGVFSRSYSSFNLRVASAHNTKNSAHRILKSCNKQNAHTLHPMCDMWSPSHCSYKDSSIFSIHILYSPFNWFSLNPAQMIYEKSIIIP
jgi:hypothetical protein